MSSFVSSRRCLRTSTDSSTSLGRSVRSMSFSSISFFNKALVSSCRSALQTIFSLSRSRSARSLSLPSLSYRMTPVACSNEAIMSSCNLAEPEI